MEISCDELHESRLPSSTRTDECGLLSSLDREREIIEYFRIIVAVRDIFYLYILRRYRESGSSTITTHRRKVIKSSPEFLYLTYIPRKCSECIKESTKRCLYHTCKKYKKTKCCKILSIFKYTNSNSQINTYSKDKPYNTNKSKESSNSFI